jgi:ribosomal protein L37AE/L43A
MKLIQITSQNRRDFTGIYECESCQNIIEKSGYDDDHFHKNVTPNWKCRTCGKSTIELPVPIATIETKYHSYQTI